VTDRCEKCGEEIAVGSFPFCPHGRGANAIEPDEVPGGFWAENGFDTPQKFYSHSEHEAALAARGMEIRAKHAGDRDKIMSNWAAGIDPVTMANAAELLSRGKPRVGTNVPELGTDPRKEFPITVTEMTDTFKYRMEH
jgi:hypothetical protein